MIIAEDIQQSSGRSMKGSYGYMPRDFKRLQQQVPADALKARTMSAQVNELQIVFIQCISLSKSSIMIALILGREND